MRILSWLIRAFIFFTLFAFALNNQHIASVHWFFGVEWRAPMVFVVLAAFAAGCALGAAAMLPGWWKGRKWMNGDFRPSTPAPAGVSTQPGLPAATTAGTSRPGTARAPAPPAPSGFGNDPTSGLGV